jgi:hypothetical protein
MSLAVTPTGQPWLNYSAAITALIAPLVDEVVTSTVVQSPTALDGPWTNVAKWNLIKEAVNTPQLLHALGENAIYSTSIRSVQVSLYFLDLRIELIEKILARMPSLDADELNIVLSWTLITRMQARAIIDRGIKYADHDNKLKH